MTNPLRKSLEEIVASINQSSKYQAGVIDGYIYVCLKDGKVHGYTDPAYKNKKVVVSRLFGASIDHETGEPYTHYATHIGKYNHMQATAFLHTMQEEPDHE